MRLTKTFMAAVLGTAALCACTEDLPEMDTSGNALQVSATVSAGTRAIVEGQLGDKQQIGVSVLATDGSDYNGKSKGYKNVLYSSSLSADGKIHWTSQKPIILSPTTGTAYAYYPYSETVSDIKAVPVETASQTDYMYADPVEGLSSSNSKANFSLNHALCAVQINIKNDSYTQGPGNISRIAVSSAELATAASLNSMTGELSAFTGQGGDIENTDAFTIGKQAHATTVMAVPTGGQDELTIKVTLDGKNHRLKMPIQTPFVKGKRYVLDILAKDKTAPLEIVSVNVKPWVEESLGEYPMEVGPYGIDDYAIEVTVKDGETFTHNVQGFNGTIDWGDGTTTHNYGNNPTHTYTKAGKYKVVATGKLTSLKNNGYMSCVTDILHIGEEIGKGITSMYDAFSYTNITKIRPGIFDNCPNVTDFGLTFYGTDITAIPQGLFDKCTKVTNFFKTFSGTKITTIPAGLFDNCTKVTNFSTTFNGTKITAIPAGLFDKCTQVTNFGYTFANCSSLTAIPAGLFDHCTNVTNFSNTFYSCSSLTAIPQGLFDNCTQVTNFSEIFMYTKITSIPAGLFDNCTNVKGFYRAFYGCYLLTAIPQGLFDGCTNVKYFSSTFEGCSALTAIPAGLFDHCTKVGDFNHTFDNCTKITAIPAGLFDHCTQVTSFKNTFNNCWGITTIPQGLFDKCTKVADFGGTFYGTNITTIPQGLFDNCPNVTSFKETFDATDITTIPQGLFDNCPNVTDFTGTFSGTKITAIPVGLFDKCTNVTNFYETFSRCYSLATIPQGLFDNCTQVTNFGSTFYGCEALTAIPAGLFDNCPNVTNFSWTFRESSALTGESPYTEIDIDGQMVKVHLYERVNYPKHFTAPTYYSTCFYKCTSLTDFAQIPDNWK